MGLLFNYVLTAKDVAGGVADDNIRGKIEPGEANLGELTDYQRDALLWAVRYDAAMNFTLLMRLNRIADFILIIAIWMGLKLLYPNGILEGLDAQIGLILDWMNAPSGSPK